MGPALPPSSPPPSCPAAPPSAPSPPRPSPPSPPTAAARVWISPSPDIQEGNAVNLTCAVESGGGEALSYTWYKNKVWFSSGSAPVLTFPSVAATDAASYHCAVQTPARTRSSDPTTLNVLCESLWAGGFMGGGGCPWHPPGTGTWPRCMVVPWGVTCPLAGPLGWEPSWRHGLEGVGGSKAWLSLGGGSVKFSLCPR